MLKTSKSTEFQIQGARWIVSDDFNVPSIESQALAWSNLAELHVHVAIVTSQRNDAQGGAAAIMLRSSYQNVYCLLIVVSFDSRLLENLDLTDQLVCFSSR